MTAEPFAGTLGDSGAAGHDRSVVQEPVEVGGEVLRAGHRVKLVPAEHEAGRRRGVVTGPGEQVRAL